MSNSEKGKEVKISKISIIKKLLSEGSFSINELAEKSGAKKNTVNVQLKHKLPKEQKIYLHNIDGVCKYSFKE